MQRLVVEAMATETLNRSWFSLRAPKLVPDRQSSDWFGEGVTHSPTCRNQLCTCLLLLLQMCLLPLRMCFLLLQAVCHCHSLKNPVRAHCQGWRWNVTKNRGLLKFWGKVDLEILRKIGSPMR
ncbi:hypothetical protein AAZV13_12G077500 [Glycine max]